MDEEENAETLAALDAILRRPGEVFTEEWEGYVPRHDGPPIFTWWRVTTPDDRVNAHFESHDSWSRGWDSLMDDPEFSQWYTEHRDSLSGDADGPDNEVSFERRANRTMRVSHNGNLVFRVPITDVWSSPDEVAAMTEIIRAVLTRRASAEGIPPPPTP